MFRVELIQVDATGLSEKIVLIHQSTEQINELLKNKFLVEVTISKES